MTTPDEPVNLPPGEVGEYPDNWVPVDAGDGGEETGS